MRGLNTFLNKHVMFEYLNFYQNSKFYLRENFAAFTQKMMGSYSKDDLLWNIFDKRPSDLDISDRDSTFVIKQAVNK